MSTIIIFLAVLPKRKTISMQPQSLLSSFVTISTVGFFFLCGTLILVSPKKLSKNEHILWISPSNYFRTHKTHIRISEGKRILFQFGRSVGLFASKGHFSFGTTSKKKTFAQLMLWFIAQIWNFVSQIHHRAFDEREKKRHSNIKLNQ